MRNVSDDNALKIPAVISDALNWNLFIRLPTATPINRDLTQLTRLARGTAFVFAMLCLSAFSHGADRQRLYGEWGTEAQCSRALITPRGTKKASPFDIRPDWLGHGDVWCRLIWSSVVEKTDGLTAVALALCGEDAVRDYQLRFNLSNGSLTLIWNLQHQNGPLMRCEV